MFDNLLLNKSFVSWVFIDLKRNRMSTITAIKIPPATCDSTSGSNETDLPDWMSSQAFTIES
jgi:hypothetical protein